jgi:hypothetical protein
MRLPCVHSAPSSPRLHVLTSVVVLKNAEDVAHEYGITAVPTFMLFKEGELMPEKSVLGPNANGVKSMIEENLKT